MFCIIWNLNKWFYWREGEWTGYNEDNLVSSAQWEIGWKKFQKVIFPNHVFRVLIRWSIPQLGKNHNIKPFIASHFSGTDLQIVNFEEKVGLLWLREGQFLNQISRVLFGFCSAYIYSFERFFCQLFNNMFDKFVGFVVFELEAKIQGKL